MGLCLAVGEEGAASFLSMEEEEGGDEEEEEEGEEEGEEGQQGAEWKRLCLLWG